MLISYYSSIRLSKAKRNIKKKVYPLKKQGRINFLYWIEPHKKNFIYIIIFSMLGDFGSDIIKGNVLGSLRFNIEQSINNSLVPIHTT